MKNIMMMAIAGLLMSSCAKEIEMCIDGDMNPDLPGEYTYTWCGTNADNIEWNTPTNQGLLAGQTVTLNFENKGTYYLGVSAYGKKKENYETYVIEVGEYETRVELEDCNAYFIGDQNYRAYVYNNINELQADFRNGNFATCLDSIDLYDSYFYNGTTNHTTATQVGGFKGLANGDYLIYVEQYDLGTWSNQGRSNLGQILYDGYATNVTVNTGDYDDILHARVTSNWVTSEANYVKNLFSKTFALTDVWINGTNSPVPVCNSDDTFTINMDKSWEYNVGADNCSGNSVTSIGTWYGIYDCLSPSGNSLTLDATSGSLASSNISLSYYSETGFDLYTYQGSNSVQFRFTAQ